MTREGPPRSPEAAAEKPEHDFEAGVRVIMEKIQALLADQSHVVVAIAGPGAGDTHVGKTTLATALARECNTQNIPHVMASNIESLAQSRLEPEMEQPRVIILDAMGSPSDVRTSKQSERYQAGVNSRLGLAAQGLGLAISKIDLRVFIYRPDKPIQPGDRLHNNVIIKNTEATDK